MCGSRGTINLGKRWGFGAFGPQRLTPSITHLLEREHGELKERRLIQEATGVAHAAFGAQHGESHTDIIKLFYSKTKHLKGCRSAIEALKFQCNLSDDVFGDIINDLFGEERQPESEDTDAT